MFKRIEGLLLIWFLVELNIKFYYKLMLILIIVRKMVFYYLELEIFRMINVGKEENEEYEFIK